MLLYYLLTSIHVFFIHLRLKGIFAGQTPSILDALNRVRDRNPIIKTPLGKES